MEKKELPSLHGEELYIPFVGAIIERMNGNKKQILIQIRDKSNDSQYSGSIEIPGGKLKAFEDIYTTVLREVKEETGLDVIAIHGQDKRIDCKNREDISSIIEPFCVTQMENGPFIGLIFICEAEGEPLQKTTESKDARWIDIEELKIILTKHPERIYTAFFAPLKKYALMKSFLD